MKYGESEKGGVAILHLKGDLLGGPDIAEFKNKIKSLLDAGKKNILIDMADVTYVNSSGIGMLIAGMTSVAQAGGKFKICNVEKNIKNVFVITNLIRVFETFNSIDEAIASF
ncbi:MAG: STAS domain-containing protein [Chloroherpetonaceae bacterium]|nr:STAS domain-containing protein [Chloroherpetonaceae bacterium]MDW8437003.1 STAS domain-containing protein [Chloroherpetonaceae bacterium]